MVCCTEEKENNDELRQGTTTIEYMMEFEGTKYYIEYYDLSETLGFNNFTTVKFSYYETKEEVDAISDEYKRIANEFRRRKTLKEKTEAKGKFCMKHPFKLVLECDYCHKVLPYDIMSFEPKEFKYCCPYCLESEML